MANTYTWNFTFDVCNQPENGHDDCIKTIHWRVTAVSDSETDADGNAISASAYGTASPELDPDNFVAFNDITKDWCKDKVLASLGQTEAELQANLDTQIDNIVNPPIVHKTPASWSA